MTHPTSAETVAVGASNATQAVTGSIGAGSLTLKDPSAVVVAANRMQESGQRIDALQGQVEFSQLAAQSLPNTDTAKACGRLDRDIKNVLKQQGQWPVAVAGQIREAVKLFTHQDDTNANSLNQSFH